jgi:hypothetical protein
VAGNAVRMVALEETMEPAEEKKQPDPDREPIFTGHKSHSEFMEGLRINAATKGFGHGIGLFLQVAIYLALLGALIFAAAWAFSR